jgi:hypothetical protein
MAKKVSVLPGNGAILLRRIAPYPPKAGQVDTKHLFDKKRS